MIVVARGKIVAGITGSGMGGIKTRVSWRGRATQEAGERAGMEGSGRTAGGEGRALIDLRWPESRQLDGLHRCGGESKDTRLSTRGARRVLG